MTLEEYKLSCVLYGHSLDVRSVAVNHDNCIISGSRDKTCKYWRPNGSNTGYVDYMTYKGHKNYVSSVGSLSPTKDYPTGLIISGGNDNNICIYILDNPEPIICHKGHTNTVCSITKGNSPNTFLTSSWDCTAKLWRLVHNSLTEVTVYTGHQAAVWAAIQLPNGNVVTGSADKDVVIWNENGQKLKVLKGHTDCVRGLALLNDNIFLSVANDATIKQWTLDGECLETFYGHGNYIYSISANKALGDDFFVTSGEDRVVKFWHNANNYQTITLPAQSVWSVACLLNGDIVTGSSDGLVRIFTQDPTRVADEAQLKQFEEEVASLNVASAQEIGGVKISDLPGKEILYEPGKTDGQTKLVREGTSVMCYSWSASEGTWNKVGDVMGAAGGTQANSGKTLYEGKEYDFVFSVDIEDGKPPLKLPYNRDQDPWFAAQTFIHKNNLSQMFLDQVANFIIQNSGGVVINQEQNTDFVDPFTGGSRYMPGSNTAQNNSGNTGMNLDPFTGASSYTTSSTRAPAPAQNLGPNPDPFTGPTIHINTQQPKTSKFFPHLSYLFFDQGNLTVIHEKLKEFNKKSGDSNHNIDDNLLDGVVQLAGGAQNDGVYLTALLQLLCWPHDIVFPVLDITRLAIRHSVNNNILCSHSNGDNLISLLRKYIIQDFPANKMLSLRILCNMFSHSAGENLILTHENEICSDILTLGNNLNKNCQIALATFLLNLSVALVKSQNTLRLLELAELIKKTILILNDSEAEFRGFVSLGTVLMNLNKFGVTRTSMNAPELREKLNKITSSNDENQLRNISCAKDLNNLFL